MLYKLKMMIRKYILREPAIHDCNEKCRYNLHGICYKYSFEYGPCNYVDYSDG